MYEMQCCKNSGYLHEENNEIQHEYPSRIFWFAPEMTSFSPEVQIKKIINDQPQLQSTEMKFDHFFAKTINAFPYKDCLKMLPQKYIRFLPNECLNLAQ